MRSMNEMPLNDSKTVEIWSPDLHEGLPLWPLSAAPVCGDPFYWPQLLPAVGPTFLEGRVRLARRKTVRGKYGLNVMRITKIHFCWCTLDTNQSEHWPVLLARKWAAPLPNHFGPGFLGWGQFFFDSKWPRIRVCAGGITLRPRSENAWAGL
jgi:hypothetical protein